MTKEKIIAPTSSTKASRVSKGERYSVDPKICKQIRKDRTFLEKEMFRLEAWKSGRTPTRMKDWSRSKWPMNDKKKLVSEEGEITPTDSTVQGELS
jgi:hypothetical protein